MKSLSVKYQIRNSQTVQALADGFLQNLDGVKELSPGIYLSLCPAHDDRNPSLGITEKEDRILVHCWAGCRTSDVLAAVGLVFPDLFLNSAEAKRTHHRTCARQPEPIPRDDWDWRKTCAELERTIQAKREHHEAILAATRGMDINGLTVPEFDELMEYVGNAYAWRERCERLDETLFDLQQTLRTEEQARNASKDERRGHEKAND